MPSLITKIYFDHFSCSAKNRNIKKYTATDISNNVVIKIFLRKQPSLTFSHCKYSSEYIFPLSVPYFHRSISFPLPRGSYFAPLSAEIFKGRTKSGKFSISLLPKEAWFITRMGECLWRFCDGHLESARC